MASAPSSTPSPGAAPQEKEPEPRKRPADSDGPAPAAGSATAAFKRLRGDGADKAADAGGDAAAAADEAPAAATAPPQRPPRASGPTVLYEGDAETLHFPGALTPRDLAALDAYLESPAVRKEMFDAVLHDSDSAQYSSRKCDAAWLKLAALPAQRKFRAAVKAANDHWRLLPPTAAGGFRCSYEDAQYTEYRGERAAHFKQWHLDAHAGGDDAEDARAITIVVLLAEPDVDFEGGDLEIMAPSYPGGTKHAVAWRRGDLVAFPAAKTWHRVMPTTKGLRRTLVIWAKDPTVAVNAAA